MILKVISKLILHSTKTKKNIFIKTNFEVRINLILCFFVTMLPRQGDQIHRVKHTFLITDILQKDDKVNNDVSRDSDDVEEDDDFDDEAEDLTTSIQTSNCQSTFLPRKARKARTAFSDSQLQSLVKKIMLFFKWF